MFPRPSAVAPTAAVTDESLTVPGPVTPPYPPTSPPVTGSVTVPWLNVPPFRSTPMLFIVLSGSVAVIATPLAVAFAARLRPVLPVEL